MVRLAVDYECRTGRHAGDLTLGQLMARMQALRDIDRLRTLDIARAVATAMSGEPKAWDDLRK